MLWEADRLLCERSLHHYVKRAWSIVEPGSAFVDNWHVKAICDHLQALTTGELKTDLLINIPPGCMKSLLTCVFWPTWVWGPYGHAWKRFFFAAYVQGLSTRDSMKCRDIIQSEWYRDRWGSRYRLLGDQNEKTYYKNSATGWRLATTPNGRGTGEHPDFIVVDDPHSAGQAESDVERQSAIDWWSGTMSSRGITRGARRVIIMQRLHKKDFSAFALTQPNITHLCLPMEFEPGRMVETPLGWQDPRTEPGELLWPALFPAHTTEDLKIRLGSKRWGQLQQRPTDPEGGMFKLANFKIVDAAPAFEDGDRIALYWDKAATQDGGDFTAGVIILMKKSGLFYVLDVTRGQWGIDQRNQIMELKSRMAASRWKKLKIWIEQEPGSGGKESTQLTIRQFRGLRVEADKKSGSKLDCWEPWAAQINAGNVHLVAGDWNEAFIQEHVDAPAGEHDDQIDAAAGAFNKLTLNPSPDLTAWLNAGALS